MRELFHVYIKDKYIGDLIHDTNGDKYDFHQVIFDTDAKLVIDILNADKDSDWFRDTLYSTRVFPKERVDAHEILKRLGLYEYDPWKILKLGHMISDDCIWMSDKMEPEWFWYNHPLASFVPGYTEKTGKPMYSQVIETDDTDIY